MGRVKEIIQRIITKLNNPFSDKVPPSGVMKNYSAKERVNRDGQNCCLYRDI